MKSDEGDILKFIEENTEAMIRYCTSIDEEKIYNEIEELVSKIKQQLINDSEFMANAILMTVALLSYEKIERNQISRLEGFRQLKGNLKLMDEILNEEKEII